MVNIIKRYLPLLILLGAGLVALLLYWTKPKPPAVSVTEKAWLVKVETVTPDTYVPSVVLYGKLGSLWSSQLTAGVAADVLDVAVIEGDSVKKDQLLIRLDERDALLVLRQREAELDEEKTRHAANLKSLPREKRLLTLAQKEVKRLQNLVAKKVSAQSALDSARQALERQAITLTSREQAIAEHKARLAKAQALRDQAALNVERCTVRAPFNGTVTKLSVSPGQRTRVGDALLQIYDTDALVVRAQIPNRYIPALHQALQQGQSIEALGDIDGRSIKVKLLRLAGEVDTGSGSVQGIFTLTADVRDLRQGRFVRLALALPPVEQVIALPHEAIYGTDRIYTVDGQQRMRAQRVERIGEVRIGDDETRVLLRSQALTAGTSVVVTQLPNAVDGLLVRQAQDQ
jgi:HlyD family secretion protein